MRFPPRPVAPVSAPDTTVLMQSTVNTSISEIVPSVAVLQMPQVSPPHLTAASFERAASAELSLPGAAPVIFSTAAIHPSPGRPAYHDQRSIFSNIAPAPHSLAQMDSANIAEAGTLPSSVVGGPISPKRLRQSVAISGLPGADMDTLSALAAASATMDMQ